LPISTFETSELRTSEKGKGLTVTPTGNVLTITAKAWVGRISPITAQNTSPVILRKEILEANI
jgi:hypothetical protein